MYINHPTMNDGTQYYMIDHYPIHSQWWSTIGCDYGCDSSHETYSQPMELTTPIPLDPINAQELDAAARSLAPMHHVQWRRQAPWPQDGGIQNDHYRSLDVSVYVDL